MIPIPGNFSNYIGCKDTIILYLNSFETLTRTVLQLPSPYFQSTVRKRKLELNTKSEYVRAGFKQFNILEFQVPLCTPLLAPALVLLPTLSTAMLTSNSTALVSSDSLFGLQNTTHGRESRIQYGNYRYMQNCLLLTGS